MPIHYGLKTTEMADDAIGNSFSDAGAQAYYWSTLRQKARVINEPTSAATLRGRWNDSKSSPTVTATNSADFVLEPGDSADSDDGIGVISLGLYASGPAVYGEHFSVRGWD